MSIHTSYWLQYGGGHKRQGTFIEYSKNFIDYLNAHHSKQRSLKVNNFTQSVYSIHYYDSILVIEKRKMGKPYAEQTGVPSFEKVKGRKSTTRRFMRMVAKVANRILQVLRLKGFAC